MNAKDFKGLRLERGLTQKQFGQLLGVSESTIAAIETGRRPISDLVRARLAQRVDFDEGLLNFLDSYRKMGNIIPN